MALAITVSCKKESKGSVVSGGSNTSAASLQPYVDAFMVNLGIAGLAPDVSSLTVNFTTTLPNNVLGSCTMGQGRVRINQVLWATLTAASREELMFHELGHCILNRGHDSTEVSGVPVSIMHPYHLGPAYYADVNLYDKYMAELFSTPLLTFAGVTFDPTMYAASMIETDDGQYILHQAADDRVFRCIDED